MFDEYIYTCRWYLYGITHTHTHEEVETGRMSEADMWKRYGKVERVNLKLVVGCGLWMLDRNSWYALVSRRTCRLLARSVFCSRYTVPLHFLSFPDTTNSLHIPPHPPFSSLFRYQEGKFRLELILNDKYLVYLLTNGGVYQSIVVFVCIFIRVCVCVL